jgi:hypothetical protein
MKKSVVLCSAAAVLLAGSAAVSRFVVLPALDQVPGNLNATVHFTGTADLLNAQALGTGDVAHAVLSNVPVSGSRQAKATATSGSAVLIDDHTIITAPGGKTLADTDRLWSLDRKDLMPAQGPSSWHAEAHQGLVAGFPLHPAPQNYSFWDTGTGTATTAHYTGTTTKAGHRVYVYAVQVSGPAPTSKATAALPPTLPKALVAGIAQTLPAPGGAAIQTAVGSATGPVVPLTYVSVDTATAWVDADTGVVLGQQARQAILAEVGTASGPQELLPVADLHLAMTPASTNDAVARANTATSGRTLLGVTIPAVLLALGLALAGIAVWRSRRPAGAGQEPTQESEAAEPLEPSGT